MSGWREPRSRRRVRPVKGTTGMKKSKKPLLVYGNCGYCGVYDFLSEDHILAVSHGGSEDATNKIMVCFPCNSAKFNYRFFSAEQVKSWMAFKKRTGLFGKNSYTKWALKHV